MSKPFFSHKVLKLVGYIVLPISIAGNYRKATYNNNIIYSLAIGLGVLWSALVLHWLKKNEQFWYGVIEILFGSVTLFYSVHIYSLGHAWDQTTLDEFLKRAALIYLIVRGIGNLDDAVKKDFWLSVHIKPRYEKVVTFLLSD